MSIIMIFTLTVASAAKVVTTYGDWTLEKFRDDTEWRICSYSGTESSVEVISSYAAIDVTYVDDYAFMDNAAVKRVAIPFGIYGLGEYSFTNCSVLEEIDLPSSIVVIGKGAFSQTTALRDINLGNTRISTVSSYAFLESGITEITLPDCCDTIMDNAFLNCMNLTAAYIPKSVGIIGSDAFKGCENLVIYAPYGSYAIDYAIAHGIDYIYSDLETYTFKIGDADGDGDITIMDATRVQRVLAKFDDDADGMISLRAAMDDDKVLGIMDATRIQRMLANFDDPYHIGESMTVYLSPDGKVIDAADDSAKSE